MAVAICKIQREKKDKNIRYIILTKSLQIEKKTMNENYTYRLKGKTSTKFVYHVQLRTEIKIYLIT
jgi:hypothetical protein